MEETPLTAEMLISPLVLQKKQSDHFYNRRYKKRQVSKV